MRGRIALLTTLAVGIVLAAGAAAWRSHVATIGSMLDARQETARALLAVSPALPPARIVSALGSADVNVMVVDRSSGVTLNYVDGALAPAPPPPPRAAMPQRERPRAAAFSVLVGDLARIAPRSATSRGISVTLLASLASLARWFTGDMIACVLALAVVAYTASSASSAAAKALVDKLEERARAASEFQRFLADAGHELRTPLTILSGYIDILHGSHDENDVRTRILPGMRAATGRMRTLVEKMLLLSKLDSPVASPQVINVASVTRDVVETARLTYPERMIHVAADENAEIHIDEDDLYEAVRNLVDNALRYAPSSAVEVTVGAKDRFVTIEVADHGAGIPKSEQPLVFERFYRGSLHTDSEGSGLGLAIVRRVAERWNGRVSLESDASGTRIALRFPQLDRAA